MSLFILLLLLMSASNWVIIRFIVPISVAAIILVSDSASYLVLDLLFTFRVSLLFSHKLGLVCWIALHSCWYVPLQLLLMNQGPWIRKSAPLTISPLFNQLRTSFILIIIFALDTTFSLNHLDLCQITLKFFLMSRVLSINGVDDRLHAPWREHRLRLYAHGRLHLTIQWLLLLWSSRCKCAGPWLTSSFLSLRFRADSADFGQLQLRFAPNAHKSLLDASLNTLSTSGSWLVPSTSLSKAVNHNSLVWITWCLRWTDHTAWLIIVARISCAVSISRT